MKRLEAGTFRFPVTHANAAAGVKLAVPAADLAMILAGVDLKDIM